jgi:hypothetical protein
LKRSKLKKISKLATTPQSIELTIDSSLMTGYPEVNRSKADFTGLIPPWKPDSFWLADDTSETVAPLGGRF